MHHNLTLNVLELFAKIGTLEEMPSGGYTEKKNMGTPAVHRIQILQGLVITTVWQSIVRDFSKSLEIKIVKEPY